MVIDCEIIPKEIFVYREPKGGEVVANKFVNSQSHAACAEPFINLEGNDCKQFISSLNNILY